MCVSSKQRREIPSGCCRNLAIQMQPSLLQNLTCSTCWNAGILPHSKQNFAQSTVDFCKRTVFIRISLSYSKYNTHGQGGARLTVPLQPHTVSQSTKDTARVLSLYLIHLPLNELSFTTKYLAVFHQQAPRLECSLWRKVLLLSWFKGGDTRLQLTALPLSHSSCKS